MSNRNTEFRYEFTVNVTVKTDRGSFGPYYDRQGEFTFCAQSAHDARAIAGRRVKGSVSTIDTTRMVEVVGSIPIGDHHGEKELV